MSDNQKSQLETELARLQAMISSPQMREQRQKVRSNHPGIRPKNAATIILIDGEGENIKVLMGKRNKSLRFMPGALVFPGGSVDPGDGSIPVTNEFDPRTQEQLLNNLPARATNRTARAIGLAAIRETAEESGLLIGQVTPFEPVARNRPIHEDWQLFAQKGVTPSLNGMVLLARAITPPGNPRRFDTWFLAAHASSIAHVPDGGFDPSGELEELQWITPNDAILSDTREITRVILVELMERLKNDPSLTPGYPAPKYYYNRGSFSKKLME